MHKVIGVIPARWASSRFPGKILAPVGGKPLLAWVVERARQARRLEVLDRLAPGESPPWLDRVLGTLA